MAEAPAPAPTPARRGPDILVRTAPPLSATSDAPLADVARPPASASNDPSDRAAGIPPEMTPEAQAAARAAQSAEAGAEPNQPAAEPAAKTPPTEQPADKKAATDKTPDVEIDTIQVDGKDVPLPPWMKREITKARNRQRDAEAAAKTAAEELAAIRATVEELKAKVEPPKPPEQPAADPRPTRDKFDDPEAYDAALTEWATREGERNAAAKIENDRKAAEEAERTKTAEAQKAAQDAEVAKLNTAWETKKAAAIEKYPDYLEVAEGDHTVSTPMAHAILIAENGTDVAYHLGQNPEESARIAALPNIGMQIFEIGRLSAQLATPPARAPRPRPLEPLDTGAAPADTSAREPSMEEWAARRNAEIRTARPPFFGGPLH